MPAAIGKRCFLLLGCPILRFLWPIFVSLFAVRYLAAGRIRSLGARCSVSVLVIAWDNVVVSSRGSVSSVVQRFPMSMMGMSLGESFGLAIAVIVSCARCFGHHDAHDRVAILSLQSAYRARV